MGRATAHGLRSVARRFAHASGVEMVPPAGQCEDKEASGGAAAANPQPMTGEQLNRLWGGGGEATGDGAVQAQAQTSAVL